MSDGMVRRLEQARLDEERAERQAAQLEESLLGDPATRALVASGVLAEQRGQWFTAREVMAGAAGRTRAEVLAYAMAQADLEDAQQAARLRKAGFTDPLAISEHFAADTSAPHPGEARVERARARVAERRASRRREIERTGRPLLAADRRRHDAPHDQIVEGLLREVGY